MNFRANLSDSIRVLTALNSRRTVDWVTLVSRKCVEAIHGGGKVMVCGNGGSYCDAEHFVEELTGRLYRDGVAIPAINAGLSAGHLTCVANDFGYEEVFSRGVEALGWAGDVLLCLSTSGKSPNILKAAEAGHRRGMTVFLLTGENIPPTLSWGTHSPPWTMTAEMPGYLCIPSGNSARIQEAHKLILHSIAEGIEDAFRGNLVYLPGDPSR